MTSYFDEDIVIIVRNFGLKLRYLFIRIYNFFFYDNTRKSDFPSDSSDELEDIDNSNDINSSDSSDDDIEKIRMDEVKNLLDELD